MAGYDRLHRMICKEKVLDESAKNTRRYRGEIVARISGSGSKSRLELLEEDSWIDEDEPILSARDHGHPGPTSSSTATPIGYERHVTPSSKPEQPHTSSADLHGLEPASQAPESTARLRLRLGAAPDADTGRPQAARSLALDDCEKAGGAEAVLREAAALAEMRALFAGADRDNNGLLDRSEVVHLAEKVMGTSLDNESIDRALTEMGAGDDELISFDDFKRWLESLQGDQRADVRPG